MWAELIRGGGVWEGCGWGLRRVYGGLLFSFYFYFIDFILFILFPPHSNVCIQALAILMLIFVMPRILNLDQLLLSSHHNILNIFKFITSLNHFLMESNSKCVWQRIYSFWLNPSTQVESKTYVSSFNNSSFLTNNLKGLWERDLGCDYICIL